MSFALSVASFVVLVLLWSGVTLGETSSEWPREAEAACLSQRFGDEHLAQRGGLGGLSVLVRIYERCGASHQLFARKTKEGSSLDVYSVDDLGGQLAASLQRGTSAADFPQVCSAIKAKSRSLSSRNEQELEALLDRLGKLEISPVMESPVVIHGASYELWIFSVTGLSHYRYQISASAGPLDALQRWVEELTQIGGIHCS